MSQTSRHLAVLTASTLAVALPLSACSSSKPKDTALLRAASVSRPVVSQADLDATATSSAAFGLDILQALAAGDGRDKNIRVAPSSLTSVLAMLLPGARGKTAEEMQHVLHTTLPGDRYADAVGALKAASGQRAAAGKAEMQQFDTLWTQKGYGVSQDYLNTLSAAFDSGVHQADFGKNPEQARKDINRTVQQQTKDLIKDLFPQGSIDATTVLVLTDALYFKAKWAAPFQPEDTQKLRFTPLDGTPDFVPTMTRTGSYSYAKGAGWQYAELPYQGGQLAMGIVLPDSGTFTQFRNHLDAAALAAMTTSAQPARVGLSLPKFTFDSGATLNDQLKALGMTSLFVPGVAELTGIPAQPSEPLYVNIVVEKTHVAVDEQDTTAAAAAGAGFMAASAPAPSDLVEMHVDRPFLFLIRDTVSGQVLFLGQVTTPQG